MPKKVTASLWMVSSLTCYLSGAAAINAAVHSSKTLEPDQNTAFLQGTILSPFQVHLKAGFT